MKWFIPRRVPDDGWTTYDYKGRALGRYIMNLLLSLDQLGNSILAGDPDETISSRIGRVQRKYTGDIPWTRPVAKATEWALDKIDKNHCAEAIEDDEGHDGLDDKPGEER